MLTRRTLLASAVPLVAAATASEAATTPAQDDSESKLLFPKDHVAVVRLQPDANTPYWQRVPSRVLCLLNKIVNRALFGYDFGELAITSEFVSAECTLPNGEKCRYVFLQLQYTYAYEVLSEQLQWVADVETSYRYPRKYEADLLKKVHFHLCETRLRKAEDLPFLVTRPEHYLPGTPPEQYVNITEPRLRIHIRKAPDGTEILDADRLLKLYT